MKTIPVNASSSYQVHIGSGLLSQLGQAAAKLVSGRQAAIISDQNVGPLYGSTARESLERAGFHVCSFFFSPGENSKTAGTFLEMLNFLAEDKLRRNDCIIALGGGVTGDLAGFAAACYLRGIPYIQVPTSLLAMVDSSVGGKTAIDLPAGKNLCGAFYQPRLVLCDTDTLDSLPEDVFRDGCAEVIKYGILYDPALFSHLEERGLRFDREAVIARCVELKRDAVEADEFDRGPRRMLNLGHTLGHAIEAESDYRLSHGQAVAIGMAMVTKAAVKSGYCHKNTEKPIVSILKKFGLPTSTEIPPERLMASVLQDKKAEQDAVHMILPREIGHCEILPIRLNGLLDFIKAGL